MKRIGKLCKGYCPSGVKFDVLFGPAYKGITLASTVSIYFATTDWIYRVQSKEKKDHGEGGKLVGADIRDMFYYTMSSRRVLHSRP